MAQDLGSLLQALDAADKAGDTQGAADIGKLISHASVPDVQVVPPGGGPNGAMAGAGNDPSAGGGEIDMGPLHIPTSENVDRFLAGAGQSVYDTGRGISQMFGGQTQADTDEQRRLDAPLDKTGAGLAGNIAGGVAQWALPGGVAARAVKGLGLATNPGALKAAQAIYRIAAPAGAGAVMGATAPVGSDESRLRNAGMGAAAGELGHVAGSGIAGALGAGADRLGVAARTAKDIADKYKIPLSIPQLSNFPLTKYIGSALDALPFSGAASRAENQRGAFNNAVGRVSGIPDAEGAINTDKFDTAQQHVGSQIGDMASNTHAYVTSDNLNDLLKVADEAARKGTSDHARIVGNTARDLVDKMVPVQNPLPNGPIATISGDAWREQNTALGQHMRSTQDGDLKRYLGNLQDSYMSMIEAGMPPKDFEKFQALRGQYRNLKTIQPLVEKAGEQGINPTLLQGRNIAARNNRGELSELGTLGKDALTSKVPNSGTAQRNMIYGTLGSLAGLGGVEYAQGKEGAGLGMASPLAGAIAGGLAGRLLHSRPAAAIYGARLPGMLAHGINGITDLSPYAAAQMAEQPDTPLKAEGHADGGTVEPYKKSSFWDLVKQAYHEATTPDDASPSHAPLGEGSAQQAAQQISGYEGKLNQAIDDQSQ